MVKLDTMINCVSFMFFGIGMLMPWNAMLASMSFYIEVYPDYKPSFALLMAVSAPIFGVQALVFFAMQKISQHIKLTFTFGLNTVITFLLVVIPLQVSNEKLSYTIVLILSVIFGISYAFLQSGLYGAAGPSPPLTNCLTIGLGFSALALNLLSMILLAATGDVYTSAKVFFYITGAFMLVCTVMAFRFIEQHKRLVKESQEK